MQDDIRGFAEKSKFKNDDFSKIKESDAKNLYDKYKNYSENDLIGEIAKLIINQKKNGTFNKTQLMNNIEQFSAFIPAPKVSELKELIEQIDKQN